MKAQLLQLPRERRVLAPGTGHPRHRGEGSGLSQEHPVEGDLLEALHDVGRGDRDPPPSEWSILKYGSYEPKEDCDVEEETQA